MNDFEQAIVAAIAGQFFAPVVQPTVDMNGQATVQWFQAPAQNMAATLFKLHEKAIFDAVQAKLDVADLATKIAAQVISKLKEDKVGLWASSNNSPSARLREKIDAAVIDKVAEMSAAEVRENMRANTK